MCDNRKFTVSDVITVFLKEFGDDVMKCSKAINENLCDVHQDIFNEYLQENLIFKTGCCSNSEKHLLCCSQFCSQCKNKNHKKCQLEECSCGFEGMNEKTYFTEKIQDFIKSNHVKLLLLRIEMKSDYKKQLSENK